MPATKTTHYVLFADMQPLDNLIVQYATNKKIKTTTLQHGLYVDYKQFENVNVVNYLHADADHFLAWGENTAKLIRKYHPHKKIYICGKPTLHHISNKKEANYFSVVFDQNIFFDHNRKLLDIAYEIANITGLKVNLRLHPNNQLKWFKLNHQKTLVGENIWVSVFVLGHTTSLLYECMRLGIPAYRYKTHVPALDLPDSYQFENTKELRSLVNDNSNKNIKNMAKHYIKEISEDSKNEYRLFFEGEKRELSSQF